jgi:hypothetical protein
MLLEICNYRGARCFLVVIFQFLWLDHHLAVASTKFAKDPATQQAHDDRIFLSCGLRKVETFNCYHMQMVQDFLNSFYGNILMFSLSKKLLCSPTEVYQ